MAKRALATAKIDLEKAAKLKLQELKGSGSSLLNKDVQNLNAKTKRKSSLKNISSKKISVKRKKIMSKIHKFLLRLSCVLMPE